MRSSSVSFTPIAWTFLIYRGNPTFLPKSILLQVRIIRHLLLENNKTMLLLEYLRVFLFCKLYLSWCRILNKSASDLHSKVSRHHQFSGWCYFYVWLFTTIITLHVFIFIIKALCNIFWSKSFFTSQKQ